MFTDSTPFTSGVYRDRECCVPVINASGAPGTLRLLSRLSLKDEATLPLPQESGFGRTLNRNPGFAQITFFSVKNTIKKTPQIGHF
jgi:hypothetical protein